MSDIKTCRYCRQFLLSDHEKQQGIHDICIDKQNEDTNFAIQRTQNNPNNEPVGHYTGRCSCCGSDDLWEDNLHYGCNNCAAFLA